MRHARKGLQQGGRLNSALDQHASAAALVQQHRISLGQLLELGSIGRRRGCDSRVKFLDKRSALRRPRSQGASRWLKRCDALQRLAQSARCYSVLRGAGSLHKQHRQLSTAVHWNKRARNRCNTGVVFERARRRLHGGPQLAVWPRGWRLATKRR